MATEQQLKRLERDWTKIAGEAVEVQEIGGTYYGFCSELGTLRLYRKYMPATNVNQGQSINLKSFYFSLTPKF